LLSRSLFIGKVTWKISERLHLGKWIKKGMLEFFSVFISTKWSHENSEFMADHQMGLFDFPSQDSSSFIREMIKSSPKEI
jgi:hypothetical protein